MDAFSKNLEKWSEKWSVIFPSDSQTAERLKALTPPFPATFCPSDSGEQNLRRERSQDQGGRFFLHSEVDPQIEAKEWFSSLKLAEVQTMFIYGLGLGYYFDAAMEWLNEKKDHYLVFLEDDDVVFRCFLGTEKAERLLSHPQVALCLLGERKELVRQFTRLTTLFGKKSIVTGLKSYIKEKNLFFSELRSTLLFMTTMNDMIYAESSTHGIVFFRNFFLNFLGISSSYLASGLLGKFKGIPAIICGAGPSLNKNIDILATLGNRALIFAGGTALNALNGKGVMPHFGVGIDPNPDQFTRLVMNTAFELPFLYRSRMLHEALEMVHGDKFYVTGSGGYNVGKWFEQHLGVENVDLEEGFNVLNFSLAIAQAMGCDPIICVGVDLAYSAGDSYAAGVANHPVHSRKSHFRTKDIDDELISKNDIYGRPVFTLWKWIAESLWYTIFSNAHPECRVINATEGGIGFVQVPNLTLEEVKQKYLTASYDLKVRLHGETQNTPLPATFNELQIISLIRELIDNLWHCGDRYESLVTALAKGIENREVNVSLLELVEEQEKLLAKETAYKVILQMFYDNFMKHKELEFNRLEAEKGNLSNEEYLLQKAVLFMERCHSLKETAQFNASIVYNMLEQRDKRNERMKERSAVEEEDNSKLRQQYPVPTPAEDERYHFDGKNFSIQDPELDLNFHEILLPEAPYRKEALIYPSGTLKFESWYREDLPHGPTVFYSENGSLLCRAWFIQGKREGKLWAYHADGSLHSLQRYKQGESDGLQQYFYPNGLPKSILPYKQGQLHGEVLLFWPSGVLFRRLPFEEGKREGKEQIWSREGQLKIECHYSKDRPVGLARMWHPQGGLAKEYIYDDQSQRIEAKEWNIHGDPVEEGGSTEDYFDQMNKETDKLTQSLSEMVQRMSEIAPMVSEKIALDRPPDHSAQGEPIQGDLSAEIAKLQQEMEYLQSLGKKIKKQLSGQTESSQEAIWKTPTSRRHLEKQFESRRGQMKDDLEKIQEGIKAVVSKLIKNDDPKEPQGPILNEMILRCTPGNLVEAGGFYLLVSSLERILRSCIRYWPSLLFPMMVLLSNNWTPYSGSPISYPA